MKYAVIVVTRNGASTIGATLSSILSQTWQPDYICIVDDGSTDETPAILEEFRNKHRCKFTVVSLPNRGYDIRRVPANLNRAYSQLEAAKLSFDYSMITGDDCVFPADYSQVLLREMENDPGLVVASGDVGIPKPPDQVRMPQGAGRFIRDEFWTKISRRYPVAAGWEPWPLFKALQFGYKVRNIGWLRFQHLRPSGSAHRFRYWGVAMRALGYHPLVAFGRIAKNIAQRGDPVPVSGSLSMLVFYLLPGSSEFDTYLIKLEPNLRSFVRVYQAARLTSFISSKIDSIL